MKRTLAFTLLLLAATAMAQEKPQGAVLFIVTDAQGKPIAGAEVGAWNEDDVWLGTTDPRGLATLTGIPGGPVFAYAVAERYMSASRDEVVVTPGEETTVRLSLDPGVPFDGQVLSDRGEPVADAYVEIEAGGTFEGATVMLADREPYDFLFTDEEGRFHVRGIPPDGIATVVVEAEGWQITRVGVKAFGDSVRPNPLVIRLFPAGLLTGTVVDPDGKPAAGATMLVVPADDEKLRENPGIVRSSTDGGSARAFRMGADPDGVCRLGGLPLGRAFVAAAVAPGFARSQWSAPFTLTAEQPTHAVGIVLRRPGRLLVRVADPAGRPVLDAEVRIGGIMSGLERKEADEGGAYRFDLAPGSHALRVERNGFLTDHRVVEVKAGETTEVAIELDRGAVISGVLVDEKGAPVAGARVTAEPKVADEGGWISIEGECDTDADGRFALHGLRRVSHQVEVRKENFDLVEETVVEVPSEGITLSGQTLGILHVRLVAPDGGALPPRPMVWRYQDGGGSGAEHDHVDGRFTFLGFKGGKERLDIRVPGYVKFVREVSVGPGEEVDLGEVVLDAGVTLRGKLLDPDGAPIPDAYLSHGEYTEATTGPDGTFRLPHLPAGKIEVELGADGFLDETTLVEVAADGAPAQLVLHRGVVIRGVLKDPAGEPLADHWLQVRRVTDEPDGVYVDGFGTGDDGTFTIRVPAGKLRVTFLEARGAPHQVLAEFDGMEGGVTDLELVLDQGE